VAGVWAVIGSVVVALVLGALWKAADGRVRASKAVPELPGPVRDLLTPDAHVTLVQLSTTFCAPCRHARVLLADLAGRVDGLRHVELDVTNLPEVAAELGVLRTPTTLALDRSGAELLRVGGVPKRDVLLDALRPHLPGPNG
jgi:thiol-disulfide isomerase/thioredoxin